VVGVTAVALHIPLHTRYSRYRYTNPRSTRMFQSVTAP